MVAVRVDALPPHTPPDLSDPLVAPPRHAHSEATTSPDLRENGFHHVLRSDASYGGVSLPAAQGLYDPENEKDSCGVGFICHIKGKPSHKIVSDAKFLLCNMTHRGATGADARDGDGAGCMTGIPDSFFRRELELDFSITLPPEGQYAVGNVFFTPKDDRLRADHQKIFESVADSVGLRVLCWRSVSVDNSILGPAALSKEPKVLQPFVVAKEHYGTGTTPAQTDAAFDENNFNRQLYVLRKSATHKIGLANWFYICSLSPSNIVYKGQLAPRQVYDYYYDLLNARYESHFALVHSRFSTNTFPSWDRAQPMRWAAHNGEINTIRGNKNWMRAREGMLRSEVFGSALDRLYPIIEPGGSDSAGFDNVLELLVVNGVLTLPQAIMLLIPEAWQGKQDQMEPEKVAFYRWAACMTEPWDGPALFAFSDGRFCGANLDRNGLRPCRYVITDDDIMICASEVGTIHIDPATVLAKGRLQPGRMLLVDTKEGRLVDDKELKMTTAQSRDFAAWLEAQLLQLPDICRLTQVNAPIAPELDATTLSTDPRLKAFGYTNEQISLLMLPMVASGKEALGSMGNDAPLACIAEAPRLVYEYFRQLFAQVTNPPIDPIRESVVMSLETYVGPEGNLLEMNPKQAHRLLLPSPMLKIEQMNAIKRIHEAVPDWKTKVIDITFPKSDGIDGYERTIDRICAEASAAINDGYTIVVLSDRSVDGERVALSSLVAVGGVHHHLIRNKARTKVALMIETAEAREVHHFCALTGYGADAVCPWLAIEVMAKVFREGLIKDDIALEDAVDNWIHAVDGGILKVMSKMGISTLASYKGAQIFEALGVDNTVIDRCFAGTASRIKGVTFELLAMDAFEFHNRGWPSQDTVLPPVLSESGEYHWRDGGEAHVNDPVSIANLQDAAREKNQFAWDQYSKQATQSVKATALRGLLDFDYSKGRAIPVDQVEPWTEIVQRFCTGAMSYGSISMEAHSALAIAMNRLGGKSNTGEGGEDAERSIPLPNGDSLRSKIKQVASGRFGVTSNYLADSDELQIKMAQGAKPGEGGELPGHKVSPSIARTRHSTAGVGLISPPPHHDIYSIEDLKQLIYDLKCANPRARVSVKLVSEVGVGIVAAGVAKAKADHVLVSGHDGGTGASRWTGIKYAGLPWELGLAETHQTLVLNDLRGRVTVQTDGQLRTGRDLAIATLLGAEEYGFATTPLIAMGCIMMRKCLGVDTLVRTAAGATKRIADVAVGDALLDDSNNPVLVMSVGDVETGEMYHVSYTLDGAEKHFQCTPDHILSLAAVDVAPTVDNSTVHFYSRCVTGKKLDEVAEHAASCMMHDLVSLGDVQDLDRVDDADELIGSESVTKELLSGHRHRAHATGASPFDPSSCAHGTQTVKVRFDFGTAMPELESDKGSDASSTAPGTPALEPAADGVALETADSLVLSEPAKESAAPVRSSSTSNEEPFIRVGAELQGRLGMLREKIQEAGECSCGGLHKVSVSFASEEQAQLVNSILLSEHHSLVEPDLVLDGDRFEVTAEDLVGHSHEKLRLFRPAATSAPEAPAEDLAYFVGAWLGDGDAHRVTLAASDAEMLVWLSTYVEQLNATRPADAAPLRLVSRKVTAVGDIVGSNAFARADMFKHTVVADGWNPLEAKLAELGLLNTQDRRVPISAFPTAEAKRAVLAGLLDTDGSYLRSSGQYVFSQTAPAHQGLVEDVNALAQELGIRTSGVAKEQGTSVVTLSGDGLAQLQPHLLYERKRMPAPASELEVTPFAVAKLAGEREYRGVEVSGGHFQLDDGLVAHNCHLNTCPVGIATQDPDLREKFAGQPEHVINFFYYLAEEMRGIMAKLGLRTINEMVGRSDLLKADYTGRNIKASKLDLSAILKPAHELRPGAATYKVRQQDHRLYVRMDNKFISEAEPALMEGLPVQVDCEVVNTDRALGATLSYRVSKLYGEEGLARDTIHINAKGSAGQSCGAFLAPGITFELEGDANDYVGKGMSGGRLIIYPPKNSAFKAEENILIGNTCLYGATSGNAYFRGIAAERFAVRNSGAHAVVEGVGDHGCEYMTGGRVVVLGSTGRNFAAGMSGGIAYVLDMNRDFYLRCNPEMVELGPVKDPHEIAELRNLIENHRHYTGSTVAEHVIRDFHYLLTRFVRVMPYDYKRVLEDEAAKAAAEKKRSSHVDLLGTLSRHSSQVSLLEEEQQEQEKAAAAKAEPAEIDIEDALLDAEKAKVALAKLDKVRGFKKYRRRAEKYRTTGVRAKDFKELSVRLTDGELKVQTARCMDCGVPFCQSDTGCPISNIIPKWNDLVFNGRWEEAYWKLMSTNNFPEFTGRVCPAPCEGACVLGITESPVGIKTVERAIIDKAFELGIVKPNPPTRRTGKTVAIVGSGPAGMACADQLNKAGHSVTVFERADRPFGLAMYGIPNMKLDKGVVMRRAELLQAEGVDIQCGVEVGRDIDAVELKEQFDELVFATGATWPRDLRVDGRNANGVLFAMDFLGANTKSLLDSSLQDGNFYNAKGKNVIVIGGGDTGNDCIGTSVRHGAASVVNFELLPQPPVSRARDNPWPQWPRIFRTDYGHTEVTDHYGEDPRHYQISTTKFEKDAEDNLVAVHTVQVAWEKDASGKWQMNKVAGTEKRWPCDLCLLALGFLGPENEAIKSLALKQDARSNILAPDMKGTQPFQTSVDGVWACGDARRGQSLVVWAIAEGRACAETVDMKLRGSSRLPWAGSIAKRTYPWTAGEVKALQA